MFGALLRGVSTRQYGEVLPRMAESVGISKSAVSERAIEASGELLERRWNDTELLVIYIDGMQFSAHHVISAVGVDFQGDKHVLGLQPGGDGERHAVKSLLVHLRERGVDTGKLYLFVIDGAQALRAAIDEVFGTEQAVQRCRTHKIRNVLEELPKEQHAQVRSLMRAAYKLERADEGLAKMEKMASWLEREYSTAAASLLSAGHPRAKAQFPVDCRAAAVWLAGQSPTDLRRTGRDGLIRATLSLKLLLTEPCIRVVILRHQRALQNESDFGIKAATW